MSIYGNAKIIRHNIVIGVIITLLSVTTAWAGPLCALGNGGSGGQDIPPTPEALNQMYVVNQVLCQKFQCPRYTMWQSYSTSNAMAWKDQTGNYIRYNPSFMTQVNSLFSSYATIGILGHELGHIIDFNQNPSNNQAVREATADQYAGCAFALAGESESNLIYMAQTLHAMGSSPGYPTAQQRVALLQDGYKKCVH